MASETAAQGTTEESRVSWYLFLAIKILAGFYLVLGSTVSILGVVYPAPVLVLESGNFAKETADGYEGFSEQTPNAFSWGVRNLACVSIILFAFIRGTPETWVGCWIIQSTREIFDTIEVYGKGDFGMGTMNFLLVVADIAAVIFMWRRLPQSPASAGPDAGAAPQAADAKDSTQAKSGTQRYIILAIKTVGGVYLLLGTVLSILGFVAPDLVIILESGKFGKKIEGGYEAATDQTPNHFQWAIRNLACVTIIMFAFFRDITNTTSAEVWLGSWVVQSVREVGDTLDWFVKGDPVMGILNFLLVVLDFAAVAVFAGERARESSGGASIPKYLSFFTKFGRAS